MTRPSLVLPVLMLLGAACAAETADVASEPVELPEQQASDVPLDCPDAGLDASHPTPGHGDAGATKDAAVDDRQTVVWETEEFTLESGKERYLCFTKPVDADLVINGYSTEGAPFVHHLIFSKMRSPGTPGFAECDKGFDFRWDPIFITGAGPGEIDFPKDAGHKLAKGQQLVAQLHLLNLEGKTVKGKVAIQMRKSTVANPTPVVSYIFGNPKVNLPPKQVSQLTGTCNVFSPVKLIAGFPHMHMMGKSMRLEVGSSAATLKEVFKRDPFSFHNQKIDPLDLSIPGGSTARLTCEWNNTTDQTIKYGESTHDEMCYFIGFALNTGGGCFTSLPPIF